MDQQKIGAFLKVLRKQKGLTQEQIAEKFNVSSRTVSRCNQRAPTDGFAEQNGRDAERADLTCSY